jgi:hypothetical protein
MVNCGTAASGTIVTDATTGTRTLELTIPSGCEADLTHICAINWTHGDVLRDTSLLIAFDGPVQVQDLHRQSVILLSSRLDGRTRLRCWCEVSGKIEVGSFEPACDVSKFTPQEAAEVNGLRFTPDNFPEGEYRVVVKGDFIRDAKGKAVDADHLPGWLPDRRTGDGIAGGTFESWFNFKSEPDE